MDNKKEGKGGKGLNGIAYLPDGSRMDYNEYIHTHPHWQAVRKARFDFDNHSCVVCHKDLTDQKYETHHLNYNHLGNERLTDVITLCPRHHSMFHSIWCKQRYWKGREPEHWDTHSLYHTARLCLLYEHEDRYLSRDINNLNMCNKDVDREYIEKYFKEQRITDNPVIDPNDISLYIRNKRYELYFEAEERGLTVEQFLNEYFGEKIRGKNPLRQEAGRKNSTFDHEPKSFHKHYSENKNLLTLMEEVDRQKEEIK